MGTNPSIVLDPNVLRGKPILRGTRLSVGFVIGLLADGWNGTDVLANYPGLTHDDILVCRESSHRVTIGHIVS